MIKNILFDFDGVILDSMPVRDFGFRKIFEDFDDDLVEKLLAFHNANGGLSRYVKIRYFYEELLKKPISEEEINDYANKFSLIMKGELSKKKYLIRETLDFIQNNYQFYNFHIVSGSDEKELRFLCETLEIARYFISIHGSPTPKNELVGTLMQEYNYDASETILIGDSINDYEAAQLHDIPFYGFNNTQLIPYATKYLQDYKELYK